MKPIPCLLLTLALTLFFSACSSVHHQDLATAVPARTSLNQGYAIFAYLMKDEANLDKILWIKDAHPQVTVHIREIAKTSRETGTELQRLASLAPSLNLKTTSLPPLEASTRDAIAKSTATTLLGNSGRAFEIRLLLTQIQATNYATHLCQELAAADSNAQRSAYMRKQGEKFLALREETIRLLGSPAATP